MVLKQKSNINVNDLNEYLNGWSADEKIDNFQIVKPVNICYIGAGYVGGTSGAVMAYKCPEDMVKVTICDTSEKKIKAWNSDMLPIFEPGLVEVVKNSRNKNLFFTTDIENSIREADIIFISVGTPTKKYGFGSGKAAELSYVESAARAISKYSISSKIVVEKSTVPCKTAEHIQTILNSNRVECYKSSGENEKDLSSVSSNATLNELIDDTDLRVEYEDNTINFEILSNPEFLAEGTAVNDIINPDRILIGGKKTKENLKAQNLLKQIYSYWVPREKIILMNLWSAELSKLAANALLAQRISSINAFSLLCEKIGADIQEVSYACGLDTRIGPKFMNASVGFGGSCFKKDVLNLVYLCESFNLIDVANYWRQVVEMNEHRKEMFIKKIFNKLYHTISGKHICIFGFSFKKNTEDTRESPAISVVMSLLREGAEVEIYDPKVSKYQILEDIKNCCYDTSFDSNYDRFKDHIKIYNDAYSAACNSDAIVICTEWDEFTTLDFEKIYNDMNRPSYIFDGRLILDHEKLKKIGFEVEAIGKMF